MEIHLIFEGNGVDAGPFPGSCIRWQFGAAKASIPARVERLLILWAAP